MEVLQVSHLPTHLEQILARDADIMLVGEHSMTAEVAEAHKTILGTAQDFRFVFLPGSRA